jgi:hypothetical protein
LKSRSAKSETPAPVACRAVAEVGSTGGSPATARAFLSDQLLGGLIELSAVVTDSGDQLESLLFTETMLLGQITDFIVLVTGDATAIRFSDVAFIIWH